MPHVLMAIQFILTIVQAILLEALSCNQQYVIVMTTTPNNGYGPFNLFWEYLNINGFGNRHYITTYTTDYGAAYPRISMDYNNNRFLLNLAI